MSLQTDRPGPATYCPGLPMGTVTPHGSVATFIGVYYQSGAPYWEAVHCTKCQRLLRWATDAESTINAALRAVGETPPEIP